MFYRGVIVPGGKVAHESLRLRCKFQWEHKCLLVLMVWFLYSSGDWLACFKCKRGMYFSKFSGSLNETCFYYGFSASSYAQGWLENYGIFFVYRALAYGTLRRSSCLFRLPAVRAKSKWESWTGQNPIFWSGSCVVSESEIFPSLGKLALPHWPFNLELQLSDVKRKLQLIHVNV